MPKPFPRRTSNETALASAAIKALRCLGYECIRVNSGRRPIPGGGYSHGARSGTPDWLVVHPYCWLEFKDLAKRNPAQIAWHAWAKRMGIPVLEEARSVAEAVGFVRKISNGLARLERLVIE